MSKWLKVISVLLAVIITIIFPLGCGAKKVESIVTSAQGGNTNLESLSLEIPPGAVSGEKQVEVSVVKKPPAIIEDLDSEEEEAYSSVYSFVGDVYNIELDGELGKPAKVQLSYSPEDIPEGFTEDNLYVAHYEDGGWRLLESEVDPVLGTVTAETTSFSFFTLIITVGGIVIATAGLIYSFMLTQPAIIGVSYKYLTPEADIIKKAVSSGQFAVDITNKRLILKDVIMKPKPRNRLARPRTGAEMMEKPEGMCEDFSNLFGSLLIAAGYPAKAVCGNITVNTDKGPVKDSHQWIEVMVDGNLYYVDTYSPHIAIPLVPIQEARTKYKIEYGKMWGKTIDGKEIPAESYDPLWPLLGEWKLERVGLNRDLPVPNIVLNRVIEEKPTWKLSRLEENKLKWDYNGKELWFNTLGQSVQPGVTITTEDESGTWCTVDRSGTLYMESLPGLFNFILSIGSRQENKKIEKITINYDDEVKLKYGEKNKATVTITVDAKGKYLATREVFNAETGQKEEKQVWKEFEQRDLILTYEAVKKK